MVAKEGSAIEEYEPEALKKILEEIHATVCKKEGEDHKTVSIRAIFSALNQYHTEKE